jgi:membrane peptidoglycan carboxypeptidase
VSERAIRLARRKHNHTATAIWYGNPQELKDVTKIYVYTGTQMAIRQDIMKEIAKKLPQLQMTEKPEDAEVVLIFGDSLALP